METTVQPPSAQQRGRLKFNPKHLTDMKTLQKEIVTIEPAAEEDIELLSQVREAAVEGVRKRDGSVVIERPSPASDEEEPEEAAFVAKGENGEILGAAIVAESLTEAEKAPIRIDKGMIPAGARPSDFTDAALISGLWAVNGEASSARIAAKLIDAARRHWPQRRMGVFLCGTQLTGKEACPILLNNGFKPRGRCKAENLPDSIWCAIEPMRKQSAAERAPLSPRLPSEKVILTKNTLPDNLDDDEALKQLEQCVEEPPRSRPAAPNGSANGSFMPQIDESDMDFGEPEPAAAPQFSKPASRPEPPAAPRQPEPRNEEAAPQAPAPQQGAAEQTDAFSIQLIGENDYFPGIRERFSEHVARSFADPGQDDFDTLAARTKEQARAIKAMEAAWNHALAACRKMQESGFNLSIQLDMKADSLD